MTFGQNGIEKGDFFILQQDQKTISKNHFKKLIYKQWNKTNQDICNF